MPSDAQNIAAYQPLRAPRGAELTCKGWQQEAAMRMLLNSLDPDVAENPRDLVIGGAAGKVTADWDSFHSIVASLRKLDDDETFLVQSGKPAAITRTTALAPRVCVDPGMGSDYFADWLYAGTQSALPVLYEIYFAAAHRHFGGTLAGKLVVGGGMGGFGGAQPLAAALNGAAFLGIDADAERIKRRVKSGYCDVMVNNLDEALRVLKNAVRQRKSASIGLIGNCAEIFPQLARRGVVPDLLTDFTPEHAPFKSYIPAGLTAQSALEARRADPSAFLQNAEQSAAIQRRALSDLEKLGTRIADALYIRQALRPLIDEGYRLSTWLALSGEPGDIARIDRLALEIFSGDERPRRWLSLAGKYVRPQGLPARVAWLPRRELGKFAQAVNDLVARGEISAPVLLGCRLPPANSTKPSSIRRGELTATSPMCIAAGACWFLLGGSDPGSLRDFSAQAIVADGTDANSEHLANWPTGEVTPTAA